MDEGAAPQVKRKRGRPKTGRMPGNIRFLRCVANALQDGGRRMMILIDGEHAQALAHIRRRDDYKNDSEAVRAAIKWFSLAKHAAKRKV